MPRQGVHHFPLEVGLFELERIELLVQVYEQGAEFLELGKVNGVSLMKARDFPAALISRRISTGSSKSSSLASKKDRTPSDFTRNAPSMTHLRLLSNSTAGSALSPE